MSGQDAAGAPDPQGETIRFAEIVLGVQVTTQPPPPGSPLARLLELDAQRAAEGRSQEWLDEALLREYPRRTGG